MFPNTTATPPPTTATTMAADNNDLLYKTVNDLNDWAVWALQRRSYLQAAHYLERALSVLRPELLQWSYRSFAQAATNVAMAFGDERAAATPSSSEGASGCNSQGPPSSTSQRSSSAFGRQIVLVNHPKNPRRRVVAEPPMTTNPEMTNPDTPPRKSCIVPVSICKDWNDPGPEGHENEFGPFWQAFVVAQPLTLQATPEDAPEEERTQGHWQRQVVEGNINFVNAVLCYNMGVGLHHHAMHMTDPVAFRSPAADTDAAAAPRGGGGKGRSALLQTALECYYRALTDLSLETLQDRQAPDRRLFETALWNNIGHIQCHFRNLTEANRCLEAIRFLLVHPSPIELMDAFFQECSFFFVGVLCPGHTPFTWAPAA